MFASTRSFALCALAVCVPLAHATNLTTQSQLGSDNQAIVEQTGIDNQAEQYQTGSGNYSRVVQEGTANVAWTRQAGFDGRVEVDEILSYQAARDNEAAMTQTGDTNRVDLTQNSPDWVRSVVDVTQNGSGNVSTIMQR